MRLLISSNLKVKLYDLILIIVNWLIKIVYYKLAEVYIFAFTLIKTILDILV